MKHSSMGCGPNCASFMFSNFIGDYSHAARSRDVRLQGDQTHLRSSDIATLKDSPQIVFARQSLGCITPSTHDE